MPALKNHRYERFAQERARGKTLTDAWERAGGTRGHRYASRLSRRPDIIQRVEEIKSGAVERAAGALAIDRQWVIQRLVENVERAMQLEPVMRGGIATGEYRYHAGAALRALELIGKELGMFVERSETRAVTHVISDEPLTPEEWKKRYVRPDEPVEPVAPPLPVKKVH
ncbi:hypothetical protein SAMN05519103_01504 [Rhizobiales bacterium GAS113]|nr:hypothetical protein SAMN05519103_01504 [Rhizobiales bacterium GAS113]